MGAGGIELWGGVECTVHRIGSEYRDQSVRLGHDARLDDLDRIAGLGVRKLRYPILWERTAPDGVENASWEWADRRLQRLRELGIEPIVTLLHHGSGPRDTNLLDPAFPEKFAAYARAVAQRYPWLRYFTPINEPLTTARFSALYGIWYPHAKSDPQFISALLHQLEGTARAMAAIREVIPEAKLVQTEDLAKTHGVESLAHQIDFENARRWLTFDLQTGSFSKNPVMNRYFRKQGFYLGERELAAYVCPPDILGVNYYVTSERFLDDRTARYDAQVVGGNDLGDRYADVPAARVCIEGSDGIGLLAEECWDRYRRPIAVTEVQLKCTREEQLRWISEIHRDLESAKARGVDIRAMTLWSLFGAFDWDSLLTRDDDSYESGAFDVRSTPPRATAIAGFARALSRGIPYDHPVLDTPGWWRSNKRFTYEPVVRSKHVAFAPAVHTGAQARPLIVVGAGEPLGGAVEYACAVRNIPVVRLAFGRAMYLSATQLVDYIRSQRAWALIDCSGTEYLSHLWATSERWPRTDPGDAGKLAAACEQTSVHLVRFSGSDVFSGRTTRAYLEGDGADAQDDAGQRQAQLERMVRDSCSRSLVIRTGVLFGAHPRADALSTIVRRLRNGRPAVVDDNVSFSAAYVHDVADLAMDLLVDAETGLWHVANGGRRTWPELVRETLECMGVSGSFEIEGCSRPARSIVLGSEHGQYLEGAEDALERSVFEQRSKESVR